MPRKVFQSAAALLGLALPGPALAAECLTPAQATALVTYVAPDAVAALAEQCKARSAPQGFFATGLDPWLATARRDADGYWPAARTAFFIVAGLGPDDAIMRKMPDSAIQAMLGPMVGATVISKMKPEDCGAAERIVELLAPLPVQNLGALVAEVGAMRKPKPGDTSGFSICP